MTNIIYESITVNGIENVETMIEKNMETFTALKAHESMETMDGWYVTCTYADSELHEYVLEKTLNEIIHVFIKASVESNNVYAEIDTVEIETLYL